MRQGLLRQVVLFRTWTKYKSDLGLGQTLFDLFLFCHWNTFVWGGKLGIKLCRKFEVFVPFFRFCAVVWITRVIELLPKIVSFFLGGFPFFVDGGFRIRGFFHGFIMADSRRSARIIFVFLLIKSLDKVAGYSKGKSFVSR